MNPILKNTLAVIAGFVAGSVVNMAIIKIGGIAVPPPPGVNLDTMEGMKAAMPLFELKHFLVPFLAHALGTLAGAALAVYMAASHKLTLALVVGALFLAGGIAAVTMLPSPMWFNVLDLVCAYIPMAWLGWKLAGRKV